MWNDKSNRLAALEKVFVGGCIVAMGTYWASETVFTISIVSITVMALVVLFTEKTS